MTEQVLLKKTKIGFIGVGNMARAVLTGLVESGLIPGENIFVIYTDWYHEMPLVISGPGAGKEVTAGGVQSDLNQLLSRLSKKV